MRAFPFSAVAMAGLAGCAINSSGSHVPVAGNYACHLQDRYERSTDPVVHLVNIRVNRQTNSVEATIDAKVEQTLAPVKANEATLFASDRFAWRPQVNAGTLTDIEKVQTFECVRDASISGTPTLDSTSLASPQRPLPFLRRGLRRG